MRSFFLPNWSPPDDPARPLPAEGRPWPSDDDDDDGGDKTTRSGNPFHMLHHSAFDCNYGNAQVKPNPAQYVQSLS